MARPWGFVAALAATASAAGAGNLADVLPPAAEGGARRLAVTSDIVIPIPGGYNCYVKDSRGAPALPGPCLWKGTNDFIWTDGDGLHLNIRPTQGCSGWASSECWITQPMGYGTYVFRMNGPLNTLDFQTTFGAFTWDDDCPGGCWFREIDLEYGRWGNPGDANAMQYVLQPYTRPGNLKRIQLASARVMSGAGVGGGGCNDGGSMNFNGAATNHITSVIQWYQGLIRWYTFDGWYGAGNLMGAGAGNLISAWEYPDRGAVPDQGNPGGGSGAHVHFNLWQANAGAPAYGRRVHVVVQGFEFNPGWIDLGAVYGANKGRLLGAAQAGARMLAGTATAESTAADFDANPAIPSAAALAGHGGGGVTKNGTLEPPLSPDPLGQLITLLRYSSLSDADKTAVIAVATIVGLNATVPPDSLSGAPGGKPGNTVVLDPAVAAAHRGAMLREWLLRMPLASGGTVADHVGLLASHHGFPHGGGGKAAGGALSNATHRAAAAVEHTASSAAAAATAVRDRGRVLMARFLSAVPVVGPAAERAARAAQAASENASYAHAANESDADAVAEGLIAKWKAARGGNESAAEEAEDAAVIAWTMGQLKSGQHFTLGDGNMHQTAHDSNIDASLGSGTAGAAYKPYKPSLGDILSNATAKLANATAQKLYKPNVDGITGNAPTTAGEAAAAGAAAPGGGGGTAAGGGAGSSLSPASIAGIAIAATLAAQLAIGSALYAGRALVRKRRGTAAANGAEDVLSGPGGASGGGPGGGPGGGKWPALMRRQTSGKGAGAATPTSAVTPSPTSAGSAAGRSSGGSTGGGAVGGGSGAAPSTTTSTTTPVVAQQPTISRFGTTSSMATAFPPAARGAPIASRDEDDAVEDEMAEAEEPRRGGDGAMRDVDLGTGGGGTSEETGGPLRFVQRGAASTTTASPKDGGSGGVGAAGGGGRTDMRVSTQFALPASGEGARALAPGGVGGGEEAVGSTALPTGVTGGGTTTSAAVGPRFAHSADFSPLARGGVASPFSGGGGGGGGGAAGAATGTGSASTVVTGGGVVGGGAPAAVPLASPAAEAEQR